MLTTGSMRPASPLHSFFHRRVDTKCYSLVLKNLLPLTDVLHSSRFLQNANFCFPQALKLHMCLRAIYRTMPANLSLLVSSWRQSIPEPVKLKRANAPEPLVVRDSRDRPDHGRARQTGKRKRGSIDCKPSIATQRAPCASSADAHKQVHRTFKADCAQCVYFKRRATWHSSLASEDVVKHGLKGRLNQLFVLHICCRFAIFCRCVFEV